MPIPVPALAFEDLEVGAEYQSAGRTITESDLTTFAGFSGDFNPIHMDHEFARATPYRRPIAHGFGVFSIASGLGTNAPRTRTVALLRVADWAFTAPVFVGDTIHLLSRVHAKAIKGRGRRGEVTWHRRILNQEGRVVQEGFMVTLVESAGPGGSEAAGRTASG